jgi:hypothetical protein
MPWGEVHGGGNCNKKNESKREKEAVQVDDTNTNTRM